MKVKVAKSAGFCVGVRRAVELVLRIADERRGRKIFTHGPLIHNPQTVEMLREKGIVVLESLAAGGKGDIVVIRSHGIDPATRAQIADAEYEIFDATCPKVAYVHAVVSKFSRDGYAAIIIGDPDHAEVLGIKGEAQGPVAVLNSPREVSALPMWDKVVVVAQTTMDGNTFEAVVAKIREKFHRVVVKNTLCSETSHRQDEIKELARESEAFVVIGGRDSANTGRLYKLALATGLPTFWVETAEELSLADFAEITRVAVVAGASTPHWIIDRVVERLGTMHLKFLPPWRWRWLKSIAYAVLRSNFLAGAAAGILTMLIAARLGVKLPLLRGFIAGAALFGTQILYEYREWQGMALMDPSKVQFVRQTRKVLLPAAVLFIAAAIVTSAFVGTETVILMAVMAVFSLCYWLLPFLERLLPASAKDTVLLLEWIAIVFFLGAAGKPVLLLPIAVLGGMRALVMGLKELETDRILQRKSLTAMFGERLSIIAGGLAAMAGIIIPVIFGYSISGLFTGIGIMWLLALFVATRALRRGTYIEAGADGILILAAILT